MSVLVFTLILLAAVMARPAILFAQAGSMGKTDVVVLPLFVPPEREDLEVLAATAADTMRLMLKLLPEYQVREPDGITRNEFYQGTGAVRTGALRRYAREKGIDNIVFGSVSAGEGREIIFSIAAYAASEDRVTLRVEETAPSIYDVFDVSDSLVFRLLEGFSETPLVFGALKFINRGYPGDYRVIIDDTLIGENISSLPKAPAGERNLRITWRVEGEEYLIFEEPVLIKEEETRKVLFSIPAIPPSLARRFSTLDEKIKTSLEEPENSRAEAVPPLFNQAEEMAAELSDSFPGKPMLQRKYEHWKEQYIRTKEDSRALMPRMSIHVDGSDAEWDNITPQLFDADGIKPYIESVSYAADPFKQVLYILLTLTDDNPNSGMWYRLWFDVNGTGSLQDNTKDNQLDIYYENGWKIRSISWDYPKKGKTEDWFWENDINADVQLGKGCIEISVPFNDINLRHNTLISAAVRNQFDEEFNRFKAKPIVFYPEGRVTPSPLEISHTQGRKHPSESSVSLSGSIPLPNFGRDQKEFASLFIPPVRRIQVDGSGDDWEGISPASPRRPMKTGQIPGVFGLYLAVDSENLYCMMEVAEDLLNYEDPIEYHVTFMQSSDLAPQYFYILLSVEDGRSSGRIEILQDDGSYEKRNVSNQVAKGEVLEYRIPLEDIPMHTYLVGNMIAFPNIRSGAPDLSGVEPIHNALVKPPVALFGDPKMFEE